MIKVVAKSYADIAGLVAGEAVVLELESYGVNTGMGGGVFERVNAGVEVPGFRVKTADGVLFRRVNAEGQRPTIKLEYLGWVPEMQGNQAPLIQRAINAAAVAGLPVEMPKPAAILRCASWLRLPKNLLEVIGNDCQIFFYFDGIKGLGIDSESGISTKISNLHIDFDRQDTRLQQVIGLWLWDQKNCVVENCRINSKENHSFLCRTSKDAAEPSSGGRFRGLECYTLKAVENEARQNLILDVDGVSSMDAIWLSSHDVPERIGHEDYEITDCNFRCGRYGIGGNWANNVRVSNTILYGNVRAFSMQNRCDGVDFSNVKALETKSAPAHVGYQSKNVSVKDSVIKTSRCDGQGLIHANVGVSGCHFENLECESTGAIGQLWGIYFGVNVTGNVAKNITLKGNFRSSVLCMESDWVAGVGYGNTIPGMKDRSDVWATEESAANVFENIEVISDSTVPAVLLHAGNNNLRAPVLRNVRILGGNHGKDFTYLESGKGKIVDMVMEGVTINPDKSDMGRVDMYACLKKAV